MSKTIREKVTIIKTCMDCKHRDHTGAFTKGGAKPCCGHPKVLKLRGYDCFKRTMRVKNGKIRIPAWCPLDNTPKPKVVTDSLTFGTQNITLKSKEID